MTNQACFIRRHPVLLGKTPNPNSQKPLQNMGWMMGLEPTTTGITNMSYKQTKQCVTSLLPKNDHFTESFVFRRLRNFVGRILGGFAAVASQKTNSPLVS